MYVYVSLFMGFNMSWINNIHLVKFLGALGTVFEQVFDQFAFQFRSAASCRDVALGQRRFRSGLLTNDLLFADELFRWNLSFSIRNADRAEPSEWEIQTRYISWTVLPIMALVVFVRGLG